MFGFFTFNNSGSKPLNLGIPNFDPTSLKIDTAAIKAKVVAVQPAGVLGRAWHVATKDFLGNAGTMAGNVAFNFVLDKSMDLFIRSLPFLVRTVGWGTSLALGTLPVIGRFLTTSSTGLITHLSRISTWLSPVTVAAANTSLPTEIKHIIVDQSSNPGALTTIRKKVEEITGSSSNTPELVPLPEISAPSIPDQNAENVINSAVKAVETLPPSGHSWLWYAGWAAVATLSIGAVYYGYSFYTKNSETMGDAFLSSIDTGHGGWLDYVAEKMDRLPTSLKKPLENLIFGDWSQIWSPDSVYPVATKAATGVTLAGIGSLFTWKFWKPKQMGYTEKEMEEIVEATEPSLKFNKSSKSSGTVTLPPELVNASPEEKAQYLLAIKNKLPEVSKQDIANELLKLNHSEQMAITQSSVFKSLIGSDNFLLQKSLQEVVASSDHMVAIVQIFLI